MGATAESPVRNTTLGILYYELLRKEVENKCGQLGSAWEYKQAFLQIDENVLRQARR